MSKNFHTIETKQKISNGIKIFWKNKPFIERLMKFVSIEPNTGCWLWTGHGDKNGYGHISINYKKFLSHRFSWILHNGVIPVKSLVLHKCDTTACVNPLHLYLGNNQNNMDDLVKRGKPRTGEYSPVSKLNWAIVNSIRSSQLSQRKLAKLYNVCKATIYYIQQHYTWVRYE